MKSSLRKLSTSMLRRELEALEKKYESLIAVADAKPDLQIAAKISELKERITSSVNELESENFDSSS